MDTSPVSQLDAEHLERVLEVRPEAATDLGLGRHQDKWGTSGPEADGAIAALVATWADARAEIDASEMSARDVTHLSMDQTVLEGSLRMLRLSVEQAKACWADPDVLAPRVRVLLRQAYQLSSTPEGAHALAARLGSLGGALEQARSTITTADAHLLERARTRAPQLKEALGDLVPIVLRQLDDRTEAQTALQGALKEAEAAVDAYVGWLGDVEAEPGRASLGEEGTTALLDARRWEMSADDVEDLCRIHIEQMRLEMRRLRRRAFKRLSVEEALGTSRSQTPYSAEEAAVWLQELGEQARQFCLESAFFPLTDDAVVVEDASPALYDLIGPVSMLGPTRDPHGPPILLLPDSKDEEALAHLSVADLEALCARYLFPGEGLHASLAVREPSWVRRGLRLGVASPVAESYGSDLILGWHLHAQELMRELQFRESPAARLVLCERALLDGVLGWFDMKLCRGQASFDEVVAGLVEHTSANEAQARWHTCCLLEAPGRAAAAVVGKARISQLRRSARIRWRHGYADRRFHDFVLHAGSLPVAVLFGLLDEFSPFNADEGTVEYELDERPDGEAAEVLGDPETPLPPDDGEAADNGEAADDAEEAGERNDALDTPTVDETLPKT